MNKKYVSVLLFGFLFVFGLFLFFKDFFIEDTSSNIVNDSVDMSWISTYSDGSLDLNDTQVLTEGVSTWSEEKTNFIAATEEVTCELVHAGSLYTKDLNDKAVNIFLSKGFNANDQKEMNVLIDKYKDDIDLHLAVSRAISGCACNTGEVFNEIISKCVVDSNSENKVSR